MVECHLAKVDVAGSSPVSRSRKTKEISRLERYSAGFFRFRSRVHTSVHTFVPTEHQLHHVAHRRAPFIEPHAGVVLAHFLRDVTGQRPSSGNLLANPDALFHASPGSPAATSEAQSTLARLGYQRIVVERPLKLRFHVPWEAIGRFKESSAFQNVVKARKDTRELQERYLHVLGRMSTVDVFSRDAFVAALQKSAAWDDTELPGPILKAMITACMERDEAAEIVCDTKGNVEPDADLRDYASGFKSLIGLINGLVPSNEVIEQAFRKTVPMYPELAVRELVANALIHQDFFVTGAGPMVEIFADRMEITNPGEPLVAAERFLDTPPKSRNETLASLMRRMGICEERGSGVDKVVFETEFFQLPAPLFEVTGEFTRAVLFAHRPLTKMDRDDRVRACYLHACLKYVNREFLTNTSVRQRFGIDQENSATASRIIKEAVEAGAITPVDEDAARKLMKYAPWWASQNRTSGTPS